MDSKEVNKAIRREVWPALKAVGFTKFTSRNGWRFHEDRVDVVNIQSFNSYLAEGLGCTTFSFGVNLGCLLRYVPEVSAGRMKSWNGYPLPAEYECHFRGGLRRTFVQPELERRDIWHIDAAGGYLDPSVNDARELLSSRGTDWFRRFEDRSAIIRILLEGEEDNDQLWGFGAPGSPRRCYLTGYVAKTLGRADLAREYLLRAAATTSYASVAERIRGDAA